MPKTVAVDVASFLDAVEAERAARSCPAVRVYRPGLEPRDSPFVSRPERDGVASDCGTGPSAALSHAAAAPSDAGSLADGELEGRDSEGEVGVAVALDSRSGEIS